MSATARDVVETYVTNGGCGECGYDELIVERGGGLVSVSCAACGFSATAQAGDVDDEWQQFMDILTDMDPADRGPFLAGAAVGIIRGIAMFFAAMFLGPLLGDAKPR